MSEALPYATMITNFDSTEQKRMWESILDIASDTTSSSATCQTAESNNPNHSNPPVPPVSPIHDLWFRDGSRRECEQLLNAHTQVATKFAGIIRTAYMYCTKIILTDAELFDGLFFLALGPDTVNGILGKSYKNDPSIVVSGRSNSLQQCLFQFTITTVDAVRADAIKKKITLSDKAHCCPATGSQHTIRPLEYCVFDHTFSHDDVLSFPKPFYDWLDLRLAQADEHGADDEKPNIIAETFDIAINHGGVPGAAVDHTSQYRFLAQRWQEWVDAERQGLILYEDQRSDESWHRISKNTHVEKLLQSKPEIQLNHDMLFAALFADTAKDMAERLCEHHHLKMDTTNTADTVEQTFLAALKAIRALPKRSDAFTYLKTTGLPTNGDLSIMTLCDWYQFVYQRVMAERLGANLIAVNTKKKSFAQIAADPKERHNDSLTLNGAIAGQLAQMPYMRFATFCYESHSAIERWRKCTARDTKHAQRSATRGVAYAVQQACDERSFAKDRKNLLINTITAAVLTLGSVLFDNVVANGGTPLIVVVPVAWAIGIIPSVMEMAAWFWATRLSERKTIVFIDELRL